MKTTDLTIPEPCHVDWDSMTGDQRRRFCGQCSKHVTHLSRMTQREAKDFLLDNPGECVQVDVLGEDILFEPTPRHSMTFRKGWLRRAATVGALLAVSTPAFASGQMTATPTWIEWAVDVVKGIVAATDTDDGKVDGKVEVQPPVVQPPVQIVPLGGAPMPDPVYMERIRVERLDRAERQAGELREVRRAAEARQAEGARQARVREARKAHERAREAREK